MLFVTVISKYFLPFTSESAVISLSYVSFSLAPLPCHLFKYETRYHGLQEGEKGMMPMSIHTQYTLHCTLYTFTSCRQAQPLIKINVLYSCCSFCLYVTCLLPFFLSHFDGDNRFKEVPRILCCVAY